MNKKEICLLSSFIIGILLLILIGCVKESEEEKAKIFRWKTEIPSGWKWYENETFGIRIGYPEKWEVEPHPYNPNIIEFKYFTSIYPETPGVVFSLKCKEVKRDFDLEAYLKEGMHWPPDEIKDVKINGIPGKQLKVLMEADTIRGTIDQTDVRTYVVSNEKLFKFWFVEDEIGKTGYQILDSVEFL
ncbi:MAG TPA: hypothetical protein HA346_01115 [Thermoplasmata archaeon]|nr:hypothetical protein [Thermoplasmata archaeon]